MPKIRTALNIHYLPIADLQAYDRNARTHSPKQIRQIADSIRQFGFNNPVLINAENRIIAGHGRVAAAQMLDMQTVPAIKLEHLTENEMRAYLIADNRLAELAGWDKSILAIEFQHLSSLELDFDLSLTGFELPAIDFMIQSIDGGVTEEPPLPLLATGPAITKPGDLWLLGNHRIFCGDALNEASYKNLLKQELTQMVFTDPPYNVPIDGHVSGNGKNKHQDFAMASGEMTPEEFTGFLRGFMQLTAQYSADGSIHFICMDWRHLQETLTAGHAVYSELKNLCVWNKTQPGMGSLYRSKHELVLVWKNGAAAHINNIELGKHGRNRSNVWDYAGQNTPHAQRDEELALHPTVKPVELVADAILDCSHRNGIILDPFGGSGTTLLAAEKTSRKARLIELEPRYVDVTIRRWQAVTGKQALHAVTKQPFDVKEGV